MADGSTKARPRKAGTSTSFKRGRKPHNARAPLEHDSLADLVRQVGSETRKVLKGGETVEMTRTERTLRLQVERALEGNKVREVASILRLMLKHPEIARSYRKEITIFIGGSDALA